MVLNKNAYVKFHKAMGHTTPVIEKMYNKAKEYNEKAAKLVGNLTHKAFMPSRGRSRTRKAGAQTRVRSRARSRGRM
jgi:hypothetical protein